MITIESLYKLFDIPPTCSDDELRHAYFRALLKHHPDRNLHNVEAATVKTQELTVAYAKLKEYRTNPEYAYDENNWQTTIDDQEFTIEFSFENKIDLDDIAGRKSAFRKDWERFKDNSSDPVSALQLIHSAFRAERSDSIKELLFNPILIDSATILLSFVDEDSAGGTYLKWAEFLRKNSHSKEAIQILEDAFAAGLKWLTISDELRSLHYSWAQYIDPTTGSKATPETRIEHLNRIIDLGFKYDYVYKLLAEAHYALGNIEQARMHLKQAYEINPNMLGAVKISRSLAFSQTEKLSKIKNKSLDKYKWSRPQQIPTITQIHEWAKEENWLTLIEFANPNHYSPRILPKARKALNQIADSLGEHRDTKSIQVLINLVNSTNYWDIDETAITSLSKIGDNSVYSFLKQYKPVNLHSEMHLKSCLSYLKARFDNRFLENLANTSLDDLLVQAKHAYKKEDYGKARAILEYLLENTESTHPSHFDVTILLARSCVEIGDSKTAIELIKPIFTKLPKELRHDISLGIVLWIFQELMSQDYTSIKDEDYQFALEILLERSLTATNPDEILDNLRTITRWLEILGVGDLTQWIRKLIKIEAPGTWYVDTHDRKSYIRNVDLSPNMKNFFFSFENQIKLKVAAKLKGMIKSTFSLDGINPINDDN